MGQHLHSRFVDRANAVHAGENARCPHGHASVVLFAGHDKHGRYLNARCVAPGCGAHQVFRAEGRA